MTDDARRSEEAFPQEEPNLLKVVASPSRHQYHGVMIPKFTTPKQTEDSTDKVASVPDLREWSKNDPSLVRCFTESSGKLNQHRLNREQHEIQDEADSTRNNTPSKTTENRISIGPHQFRDNNPQVLQHKPEKRAPFPEFGDGSTNDFQAYACMEMIYDSSLADGYRHMTKPEEMLPKPTNTNQSKDHGSLNSKNLKGCGCFPWG